MKYFYTITIIFIIVLSAVFRLGFLDSTLFGGDEESTACKISSCVNGHRLPPLFTTLHGMPTVSTVGVWFYLIMSFIHDPRMITLVAIGIPNTIAVILCFLFCYKFIDKRTAIVATALFGFSNWAIIYSKNLWGVDILQFFSILVFFTLMLGIYRHKLSIIIFSVLLLPFLPNLHLTSFSIFVSFFLILSIYFFKTKLKYLFLFLLIILIVAFVSKEGLNRKLGLDRNIIADFYTLNAVLTTINLVVRGGWHYLYLYISPKYPNMEIFSELFLKILFILGCIYIIKKMAQDLKRKHFSAYFIIGMWYFVFAVIFGFIDLTTHAHYFMVVLPALFIIASIGFFSLIDLVTGKNKIQNWEFLLLFLIFMLWSPWITGLSFSVMLLIKKIPKVISVSTLCFIILFIMVFQAISNIQLFNDIKKLGKVPGRAGMDLGAKIDAARYILGDAQSKFKQTGVKSYYSIINDSGYAYLFRYLTPINGNFISDNKINSGYHYTIVGDADIFADTSMLNNSLYYKRIGPKLVIVERINEV